MNFEEWLIKTNDPYDSKYRDIGLARDSWDACKKEMIKILNNNKKEICSHGYDSGMEYVYLDWVKEEIERL